MHLPRVPAVGAALLALAILAVAPEALGCPSCPTTDRVRCAVLGAGFWGNVGAALLPFVVIGATTVSIAPPWARRGSKSDAAPRPYRGPLVLAGVLLGTGLGGFVDGIVLHQILQWHNMLSSVLPPTNLVDAKVNMVWDGLLHAFTWMMTVAGVACLFRAGGRADVPWSGRILVGGGLAGEPPRRDG